MKLSFNPKDVLGPQDAWHGNPKLRKLGKCYTANSLAGLQDLIDSGEEPARLKQVNYYLYPPYAYGVGTMDMLLYAMLILPADKVIRKEEECDKS